MGKETSPTERMSAIKMRYEKDAFVFARTIEKLTLDYDTEVARLRKELAIKKMWALIKCAWWPPGVLTMYEKDVKAEPYIIPKRKGEKMKKEIFYNYQAPVQTDIDQWSVFVRKIEDSVLVKVLEHKFTTEATAKAFAINNLNLGNY